MGAKTNIESHTAMCYLVVMSICVGTLRLFKSGRGCKIRCLFEFFLIFKTGERSALESVCTLDKWEEVENVLGVLLVDLHLLAQVDKLLLEVGLQPRVALNILPAV